MTREELDQTLRDLLTEFEIDTQDGHIYFQPPSNVFIKYPAFIYNVSGIRTASADNNKLYQFITEYDLHWIHEDPGTEMVRVIMEKFPFASYTMRTTENAVYNDGFRLFV